MPPEILALIDKPLLLMAMLALGAVLGITVERLVEGQKRAERRAYWKGRNGAKRNASITRMRKGTDAKLADMFGAAKDAGAYAKATSATDQLACVMGAKFSSRPLLNRPEANLF